MEYFFLLFITLIMFIILLWFNLFIPLYFNNWINNFVLNPEGKKFYFFSSISDLFNSKLKIKYDKTIIINQQ